METIKARFVGGPRHNEIIECSRLPAMYFAVPIDPPSLYELHRYDRLDKYEPLFKQTTYYLHRFVSEGGARFAQYIHESELDAGQPKRSTFTDPSLPPLPDDVEREFWYRLVRAYCRAVATK